MSTELSEVAKASARGSFFLFLGKTSSTIIMAFASILVARLLGPENYGLYALAMIAPALLITLSDLGISPALIRFSARFRSEGKNLKVLALIKAGIIFKIIFSMLLSIALILLSETIATWLLRRPSIWFLIRFTTLYLLGQAIFMALNSLFIGLDKTENSLILMNTQATTKAVSSSLLIILGMSVIGATLGAGLGSLVAAATGFTILLLRIRPNLQSNNDTENINFLQALKLMIPYGIPLYLSTITFTLLTQYRTFILALFASNMEIGNYTIAMNFSILITLISYPIATSLFPAFSKLSAKEDYETVKKMFMLSAKYTALLIIPSILAMALFSEQLIHILYGLQYQLAPTYLTLYVLSFLCDGLGMFVVGNLFNGQGDTKTTLRVNLTNLSLSLPVAFILTSHYGVIGLLASILTSQFISTTYALYLAHKKYKMTIDLTASIRTATTSLISTLLTYVLITLTPTPNPILKLAIGAPLFITSFLALAPLLGAINRQDIYNLDELTRGIALIYPIARRILSLESKILSLRS